MEQLKVHKLNKKMHACMNVSVTQPIRSPIACEIHGKKSHPRYSGTRTWRTLSFQLLSCFAHKRWFILVWNWHASQFYDIPLSINIARLRVQTFCISVLHACRKIRANRYPPPPKKEKEKKDILSSSIQTNSEGIPSWIMTRHCPIISPLLSVAKP